MIVKHIIVLVGYTACFYFWYKIGVHMKDKKQEKANLEEAKRIINNKKHINEY